MGIEQLSGDQDVSNNKPVVAIMSISFSCSFLVFVLELRKVKPPKTIERAEFMDIRILSCLHIAVSRS